MNPDRSTSHTQTHPTASIVIDEYAKNSASSQASTRFVQPLLAIIEQERPSHYRDLVTYVQRVRSQSQQLLNLCRDHGKVSQSKLPTLAVVVQGEPEAGPGAFSIANAEKVVNEDFERLKKIMAPGQRLIAVK
ncbi:DUF3535 domain-containing protein, partial [Escherichia coli]|nr:DUF3535 domain-containing protein [Escherichia coli]